MRPDPDLRETRAFLVLAEELHFGRTAEQLGVTHSRVSQLIRTLEAKIGGRLFERTSRSVRLTPVGERLRNNLVTPFAELERGFTDAQEAATGVTGTLRIGMYQRTSSGPHWHSILQTFRARHPSCETQLIHLNFDRNYLDLLRSREAEMLATRLPLSDGDMAIGPILSHEPRVLLVSGEDPLAERDSVCVEDFADRAVFDAPGFPREMMDAFFPPVSPSGRRFRRVPVRTTEELMMRLAAGQAVHPTVPSFLQYYPDDATAAIPISDLPPSQTALVWLTAHNSPKIQAFVRAAADVLARTDLARNQR